MELTKNIFFNTDKLLQGTKVKISYIGKLFQSSSEGVYIHYGFGNAWTDLAEVEMEKTDLGFQVEIVLSDSECTFNFCFRDKNNNWDNNEGLNYVFDIEPLPLHDILVDELGLIEVSPRKLRKAYLWSKKVRLAIYKIITFIPKLVSGNYKRSKTPQD